MRVFVTGATGFVGSAVIQDLIKAGHEVTGLARSDASAKALIAAGAKVHRGDIEDLGSVRAGAAASDGVIHTAFIHDFAKFEANCRVDQRVIEAMGAELTGSYRPFVITSGTALLKPGQRGTEADARDENPFAGHRGPSEDLALALASQGVRTSIVRLPPSVHGEGDHGFIPHLMNVARKTGVSVYIGEGLNVWPAVHRLDAAQVFRLALEKGAAGSRFHAAAEEGIPFREIAEVIGKRLNLPVVSKTPEEAAKHFEWFARFAAIDNPVSSKQTREQLGWNPIHPGLIFDVNEHYGKD